jgi:hypothetical protein
MGEKGNVSSKKLKFLSTYVILTLSNFCKMRFLLQICLETDKDLRQHSWYSDQARCWITEEFWFNSWYGQKNFSSSGRPDRLWGPPSLLFGGYWRLYLGVTQAQCEAEHSLPSSVTKVKNGDGSMPPYTFMVSRGTTLLLSYNQTNTVISYFT